MLFKDDLEYREYAGMSQTGQANSFKEPRFVKGTLLKADVKNTHDSDGDVTIYNMIYRVEEHIIAQSKLEGREVVFCRKNPAFGRDHGYMVYVK